MEESSSNGDLFLIDDLLLQILVWLPVITLLRFKSVCKSWRSIIESTDFIHRHATYNNDIDSANKLGTLIFQSSHFFRDMGQFYVPHFFVLGGSSGVDPGCWLYKDLGVPPYPIGECLQRFKQRGPSGQVLEMHRPVTMVASCNGIICLHDIFRRDIYLWNPATKQFRTLPKSLPLEEAFGEFQDDYVGFGFDKETKDYKVLLITSFKPDYYWEEEEEPKTKNRVQVYSMSTNSWRWCGDVDLPAYCIATDVLKQGFYHNGHFLFLAKQFYAISVEGEKDIKMKTVVVSFDFSKEICQIVPAPTDNARLDISDGKIVCVTYLLYDHKCELYVLNDFSGYSWTKLYETRIYQVHNCHGPMAISKDGRSVFLKGSDYFGLMLYNLETEEPKDIQITNVSFKNVIVYRAQIYKESLVSIYTS